MTNYFNGNDLDWNPNTSDERRKHQRRTGRDRREMLRFDLDKLDRRMSTDRRRSATSWGNAQPI